MATTQPAPAYTGDKAPPASSVQQITRQNQKIHWIYWGALFATPLTWVFAVAATVNREWFDYTNIEDTFGGFDAQFCNNEHKSSYGYETSPEMDAICSTFTAAKAFQYMATILVSIVLVMVVAAALQAAPTTGKLGLAAGVTLVVFSVFQLVAFSLMADVTQKYENLRNSIWGMYSSLSLDEINPGPTFGWAVVASAFGLAGAVTVLVLRARATAGQDGPLRKWVSSANKTHWIYWGALFATPVTWVFAVAATVSKEWMMTTEETGIGFEHVFCSNEYKESFDEDALKMDAICSTFIAAKAFQYMATILVSIVLVLVVAAALQAAPTTGKLGLAAGVTLVVFSVFQLVAFSLMADVTQKFDALVQSRYSSADEISPGPTFGWAVVACVFGLAGAITVIVLRARATAGQDGPLRKCISSATGPNTGTPAGEPAAPAVGTV